MQMRQPAYGILQHFLVTPIRVMVRFGMWDAILDEPAPPGDLPYAIGTWHYARGMALARTGRPGDAIDELAALRDAEADPALAQVSLWGLNPGSAILALAELVLAGEIAAAGGNLEEAIEVLQDGIRLEAGLIYAEPPDWHLPIRHVLGAVLLEAGQSAAAAAVYQQDLGRFPENGWALYGLLQWLGGRRQNQGS